MPKQGYRKPLTFKERPCPEGTPEHIWLAPKRIAEIANRRGLGQPEIAELAKVDPGTVSRWMNGSVPDVASLARLEEGLKLSRGELTGGTHSVSAPVVDIAGAASSMGMSQDVIDALLGGGALEMRELPENLKRAVLGAVHLLGYPLEVATRAAARARESKPVGLQLSPDSWLTEMRPILNELGRPGSGTFPSSSKLKLG